MDLLQFVVILLIVLQQGILLKGIVLNIINILLMMTTAICSCWIQMMMKGRLTLTLSTPMLTNYTLCKPLEGISMLEASEADSVINLVEFV
jgi:hypothetical protein